ncbi:MAG: tetratricopeptide repeat protein [Bacteroidota bacterium]
MLLLAKSYIEREKFTRAETILKELEKRPTLFKETLREIPVVYAYRHLEQENYTLAIPFLEKSIELANKKKNRARYSYILAQLYQKLGDREKAYAMFNEVSKMNPAYEMEFNANLNIERNAWAAGKSDADQILRNLKKMSKDFKNEEYKDQIFFAMAEVALSQNDREKAKEHLLSSIEASTNNKSQLLESNYLLASLYFEDNAYVEAKKHYDMALANMAKEDDRYKDIKRLSDNLTDIAANIQTIELQDSLLAISEMSEKEQKAIAAKIKKDMEEAKNSGKDLLAGIGGKNKPGRGSLGTGSAVSVRGGSSAPRGPSALSTYFAYNEKSVKKGKKEFLVYFINM